MFGKKLSVFALIVLAAILTGCGESNEVKRQNVTVAFMANDPLRTVVLAESFLLDYPQDKDIRFLLARSLLNLSRLDEAARNLDLILTENPDWIDRKSVV